MVFLCFLFLSFPNKATTDQLISSPLDPEAALQTFQVDPGLQIQLVVAEPLVVAPCALTWDTKRRLYVAENRGYPTGSADGRALGVIALLEDVSGNGQMDARTVFADNLTFPNGLLAWDGGIIVTCAPDILFLKDTDDDGKADIRRVLLTGFDTRSSTQLRVAHPTLGPDGWIYLTSGLARTGNITSPQHPDRPAVSIGTDSRFNPFTLEIEPVDGRGQFGQSFDDWGNRFHCMNRIHIQHTVLSGNDLNRNPDFAFSEKVQNVPEAMVDDLLKSRNLAARIYPVSDNLTTADSHAGSFSAASSVHVYRGDGLPSSYYGSVFACDPTGNLVHRDILTPQGPTFSSRMANEGREFFASRDNWFRPVFVTTGPDGSLYVCDMYRSTIEHPDYLPVEVRKRTDFESGRNRGRIWRISKMPSSNRHKTALHVKIDTQSKTRDIASYDVRELVELLGHGNVWRRESAMRLLIERNTQYAIPLLLKDLPLPLSDDDHGEFLRRKRLIEEVPGSPRALRRVNALNTLLILSGWDPEQPVGDFESKAVSDIVLRLFFATVDEFPGVRITAWRHLGRIPHPGPEFADDLIMHWADDPNPAVRFKVALALGQWERKAVVPALARIALQDGANKWTRAAVMIGLNGRDGFDFLNRLTRADRKPAPELMFELGRYLAQIDPERIGSHGFRTKHVHWSEVDLEWRFAFWSGVIEGDRRKKDDSFRVNLLDRFGFSKSEQALLIQKASGILNNRERNIEVRKAVARVLFATSNPEAIQQVFRLLQPGQSSELQSTIVYLITTLPGETGGTLLLEGELWETLNPRNRDLFVSGMLSRGSTTEGLLSAIQQDLLPVTALSIAQRNRLQNHKDVRIRSLADELFASAGGDRMKVYEQLKSVVSLPAVPKNGKELFKAQCASCHRLEREGFNVGPDLFGIRNQSKEATLLHILVPGYEVLSGFSGYDIETNEGLLLSGLIVSETETSITLRMAQGIEETIRRDGIETLKVSALSLMPDGFEQTMSRQDLADLLAFLKGE